MRIACVVLVVTVCLPGVGCQSSQYVTRRELRELLKVPPSETSKGAGNSHDLDSLVADVFTVPDAEAGAAAALATADQRTARLTAAVAAIDRALAVCADNLANAETTAFKRQSVGYDPSGAADFRRDFTQAALESTGRQLDVAIEGDGMFAIAIPGGVGYTRNGNFFVNHEGELVLGMGDGYHLAARITVPKLATEVSIHENGTVEGVVSGSARKIALGRLPVVRFRNPEGLALRAGTIFTATAASGAAEEVEVGEGVRVLQGFLETSNVDPMRERIRMTFLRGWRDAVVRAIDVAR